VQALQKPGGADRIAAVWYSPTNFTIDVNITDGQVHQIALYGLDYPLEGRSQRIDVLNATTQAVLDTRTVSGFSGGQYWVWQIGGHVTFRITNMGPGNAVLSGVFFDAEGALRFPVSLGFALYRQRIVSVLHVSYCTKKPRSIAVGCMGEIR